MKPATTLGACLMLHPRALTAQLTLAVACAAGGAKRPMIALCSFSLSGRG